jgi:hypothetical protein
MSAVWVCLFNISAATLHIGGISSIRNLSMRDAMVTGTHLSQPYECWKGTQNVYGNTQHGKEDILGAYLHTRHGTCLYLKHIPLGGCFLENRVYMILKVYGIKSDMFLVYLCLQTNGTVSCWTDLSDTVLLFVGY